MFGGQSEVGAKSVHIRTLNDICSDAYGSRVQSRGPRFAVDDLTSNASDLHPLRSFPIFTVYKRQLIILWCHFCL
jgi:hypothetical protein